METLTVEKEHLEELAKALYKVEFFSSFKRKDFDNMSGSFELLSYEAGEVVFKQGAEGHSFYVVLEGAVQVYKKQLLFMNKQVAELGKREFFGEMALISRIPRTATIRADNGAKIFRLACTDFTYLFEHNPSFKDALKAIARRRGLDTA